LFFRPLLGIASLLVATSARADILFDQMTNPQSGVIASSWLPPDGFDADTYSYDNFLLPSRSSINEVWWIGGGDPISGVTVRFYTGLAGAPDYQPTITALPENETSSDYLAGYAFSGNANQTAIPGSSLYQYHVVLPTALTLPGNTVFWIKIEGDQAYQGQGWGVARASHGRDSRHISYFTGLAQFLPGSGSEAFQLRGSVQCPGDFNSDGVLNADDLADFITGYFNVPSDARCDFNGDGVINADDLGDFITAYFNGC
jgi:hypothetical protein